MSWGGDMKDKGKLWVDEKKSRITKRLIDLGLEVMHKSISPWIKTDRSKIRNERVRFFYDCLTEFIGREQNKLVKGRLIQIRDFVILLLDDDRAYRYRAYFLMVIFFKRMGEFYTTPDDWYMTEDERAKFEAMKKAILKI